jgi:death-on-curing protein
MLFPRKDEVLEIHQRLLEQFSGLPGIRDEGMLDSALLAPAQRQHYEGVDLAICAATYLDLCPLFGVTAPGSGRQAVVAGRGD